MAIIDFFPSTKIIVSTKTIQIELAIYDYLHMHGSVIL